MNKYKIGDKIQFKDEYGRLNDGIVWQIQAVTKRYNASLSAPSHSEIVTTAGVGYKCLGSQSKIREKDVVGLID